MGTLHPSTQSAIVINTDIIMMRLSRIFMAAGLLAVVTARPQINYNGVPSVHPLMVESETGISSFSASRNNDGWSWSSLFSGISKTVQKAAKTVTDTTDNIYKAATQAVKAAKAKAAKSPKPNQKKITQQLKKIYQNAGKKVAKVFEAVAKKINSIIPQKAVVKSRKNTAKSGKSSKKIKLL